MPSRFCCLTLIFLLGQCQTSGPATTGPAVATEPVEMRDSVRLDVPAITQHRESLSGAASVEMVFRYWGESRYSQLEIASALVWKFRENKRFYKSHTLFQIRSGKTADEMDWSSYPGSGTGYIREFLEPIAPTENHRIQHLPRNTRAIQELEEKRLAQLKESVNRGIPVIVHQWVDSSRENQRFRVVTGFDSRNGMIYLNDPASGPIKMKDSEFLYLWQVDEVWLPYNSIVFNKSDARQVKQGELKVELELP